MSTRHPLAPLAKADSTYDERDASNAAGLTYLGIGVPSGVPSWGHSLATSVKLINVFPLTVVWPGLIVTVVVVALKIFGDVLRDAIDPVTNPALREIGGER